jgi:hypothetical protein
VSHPRFGGTVVWALAAIGDPDVTGKVLTELEGVDPERRIEASFHLAACGTPGVLEWIRALAGREGLEAEQEETLREALLRAGDPAVLEETRAALQDDAPEVVAGALRILGESRNLSLLEEIVRHVDDDTDITALELRSRFARKTTSTDDRGWTTERTEYPALSTLGDVALEAVNRLHAPTTPEYIAWWYEVLPTPWFTGEDARKRLRAYLEADRRARAAGAVSGARALEALVHALRPELQHRQVSRLGFEFDEEGWVIHLEVDGASRQRRISPAGEVRD